MSQFHHRVFFIFGVSGSGKSTIGKRVAERLRIPFFDGDDFHPPSNRNKMTIGTPLNDEDRKEWLVSINKLALKEMKNHSLVIACSALKESYRELLMENIKNQCHWFLLDGSYHIIFERMSRRKEHYMPTSLLQSQFDLLEVPAYAVSISIELSPKEIVDLILSSITEMNSTIGVIGLGVMGTNLARNFARKGLSLSLYNQRVEKMEEEVAKKVIQKYPELQLAKGFEDLSKFVQSLKSPRVIVCMIPAGVPIDQLIENLMPFLSPDDMLIDCGNSHYKDSEKRQKQLESSGIQFIGTGVSGGEEGALNGPSIMMGGSIQSYEKVKIFFESIAAIDKMGRPCCARVGNGGAGHFVKMVHNGIEYAEMQLLAEVYGIMRWGCGFSPDEIADVFESWMDTEVSSYLLSISKDILRKRENESWLIDLILDTAGSKGTGAWTTIAAAELGVPIPTIAEALFARYVSSLKNLREQLNNKIGPQIKTVSISPDMLWGAYRLARLSNHQQGFQLIDVASKQFDWQIDLSSLARIWTNGCIIRSTLMENLAITLNENSNVFISPSIQRIINTDTESCLSMLGEAMKANIPIPAFASAIIYLQSISQANSSGNIIQAQRDYFGAHGYQRIDDPLRGKVHTTWKD